MSNVELTVIIPTFNEEENLPILLNQLAQIKLKLEILIIDGGSTDDTLEKAKEFNTIIHKTKKGRGNQLFEGGKLAKANYLLFLHADNHFKDPTSLDFELLIERRVQLASFKIMFASKNCFLRMNAFFSRFHQAAFYFGDQGLWVSKDLYENAGAYDPLDKVLEDQIFYRKLVRIQKAIKLPQTIVVNSCKYQKIGALKLQLFYYKLWIKYRLGYSRERLERSYSEFFRKSSLKT